jgi:hypothetical protein
MGSVSTGIKLVFLDKNLILVLIPKCGFKVKFYGIASVKYRYIL